MIRVGCPSFGTDSVVGIGSYMRELLNRFDQTLVRPVFVRAHRSKQRPRLYLTGKSTDLAARRGVVDPATHFCGIN